MSKKKLSALELLLKKMAVLATDCFAPKQHNHNDDYFTKQEVGQIVSAVTDGAQAAELFTLRVDPDTMELKALSTMANLTAFRVTDGYLAIDLAAS